LSLNSSLQKKPDDNAFVAGTMAFSSAHAEDMRIALVVKALGIGFFEAAAKGAEEAAAELGDVEVIYTGPTDTTADWFRHLKKQWTEVLL